MFVHLSVNLFTGGGRVGDHAPPRTIPPGTISSGIIPPLWDHTPPEPQKRAVRTLLECFLVEIYIVVKKKVDNVVCFFICPITNTEPTNTSRVLGSAFGKRSRAALFNKTSQNEGLLVTN